MQQLTAETKTDRDAFLDHAVHLETLLEDTDDSSLSSIEEDPIDEEGGPSETEKTSLLRKKRRNRRRRKLCCSNWLRRWRTFLDPEGIRDSLIHFLKVDVAMIMAPLMAVAFLLFYGLGNPDFEFLPNSATLAWYLVFLVRLEVTFSLARCTQFLLELATIRSSWLAQWSGPLVAILAMQSIGWPFLLTSWGAWNSILLHGSHPFCKHWLGFTNIAIFTVDYNPDGDGILQSDLYGRILFAMMFVGTACAVKRTTVALFLSRRMLTNYKPQLEQIMQDVKLITGIAELAAETEKKGFEELLADVADDDQSVATVASQVLHMSKTDYMESVPTFDTQDDAEEAIINMGDSETPQDVQWEELKEQAFSERTNVPTSTTPTAITALPTDNKKDDSPTSTFDRVMSTMDHYEPPKDLGSKQESPTLSDILQFRKAMNFMRNGYPFTPIFGPAGSRQSCVQSAILVFRKLQKFLPADDASKKEKDNNIDLLCFDVIGALAFREDGTLDASCAQGLLQLFLPDKDHETSLDSFVQSIDAVYKQILFLGASMSNTSKIDSVLEDGFNVAFYGALSVMVLSLVGWNPWPLLASLGTMLLSLAFALGPSCAKSIEGVLAIAVRRPFDLGDRISLASGLGGSASLSDTWIVEDINLTTTTLRFAGTNEVSTINNSSLSGARIVNCARSPKAIVRFRIAFRVSVSQQQLQSFRQGLEAYLLDHPQNWAGLLLFANDGVQSDDGFIVYNVSVQHVKAWQELSKIVVNRGELEREANRIAHELEIHYESEEGKHNIELVQKTANVC